MTLTNLYNLPLSVVRAMENDKYSKGDSDFSVTQLLNPPRQEALKEIHKDELVEEASNRIFALLGQATHVILERGAREGIDLVERRFFATFLGKRVSGQIDLLERDSGVLSDFKVTKAYPFTKKGGKGLKPEWIAQLNMQLELMRQNGESAERLQIVGIVRDWDEKCLDPYNKLKYLEGYPPTEIVTVPVPIWERKKTVAFIEERVDLHLQAKVLIPRCGSAETWGGDRCKGYCVVSPHCEQYKNATKTGLLNPDKTMKE